MKTQLITRGKNRWKRTERLYIPENAIEATILSLLDSLRNLDHQESMADTSCIVTCHEYAMHREDIKSELYHVLG